MMRPTIYLILHVFQLLVWTLVLASTKSQVEAESSAASCEPSSTRASSLTPNTFHKLCPSNSALGEPICGDGTPFSFYYTSPVQRRSANKILIEFLGGGACWDANTCDYNAQMLTFPYQFDNFLGLSCSQIAAGASGQFNNNNGDGDEEEGQDYEDLPINMLCAQEVGGTDFREYHTVIIPYCTQDTHMGSNTVTYDDGTTVNHRGASNMLSVLEWIFKNFPHPEAIVLTGCSAGGTVLPVAYDLVYHHYNSWTKGRSTAITTLLDSPVYLTPSYFMEEGLPNWNVQPIMNKVRFNFYKHSQSENFSNELVKHVLKRGSKKDKFGLITHNSDPVSLAYFQRMSQSYNDDDDKDRRFLEDNQDADEQEWWSQLYSSISSISDSHSNVATYILDGEGHCSFGLYYALMEGGEDFEQWAGNLLHFPKPHRATGRGWFWISALLGCTVIAATLYHQRRMQKLRDQEANQHEEVYAQQTSLKGATVAAVQRIAAFIALYSKDSPVTIAYGVAVTIYFVRLMTWDGLELFLYNPSLGPSAHTLSAFGINNPTLVVYKHQFLRVLVTSTFLCSGIITYAMFMFSLFYQIRRLEKTMRDMAQPSTGRYQFASLSFLQVATLISVGSNLIYAMFANGASCSSMALVLGLQTFSCTMHRYHDQKEFPNPMATTTLMFLFTAILLPFNSWLMMGSAIFLGLGLAIWVYWVYVPCFVSPAALHKPDDLRVTGQHTSYSQYTSYSETDYTQTTNNTNDHTALTLLRRNRPLQAILAFFVLLLICLVARIRRPNRVYEQPFLTGCELVYTTHVDEIAGSYIESQFGASGSGDESEEDGQQEGGQDGQQDQEGQDEDNEGGRNRKRRLENNSGDNAEEEDRAEEHMCAQFCIPHLVSRPFLWGADLYTGFDVQHGFCEDVGYSQHIADKTFSYKSYAVDVELFFNDDYNYNDEGGDDE